MAFPLVILVEDNVPDAELTRAALSGLDIKLEVVVVPDAEAGRRALLEALARSRRPDGVLLLVDLTLPGEDGLSMVRQLKEDEATRAVPVVVFSGSDEPERVREALLAHANAFVHKADDVDTYLRRVMRVVEVFLVHSMQAPASAPR